MDSNKARSKHCPQLDFSNKCDYIVIGLQSVLSACKYSLFKTKPIVFLNHNDNVSLSVRLTTKRTCNSGSEQRD